MLSRLSRNTGMREYSCSRNSARRPSSVCVGMDGDDVGPRRHDFAHERVAEIDNRLQQLALVLCPLDAPASPAAVPLMTSPSSFTSSRFTETGAVRSLRE